MKIVSDSMALFLLSVTVDADRVCVRIFLEASTVEKHHLWSAAEVEKHECHAFFPTDFLTILWN